MELEGVIFDFGFTLFYFKDASLERYLKCFKMGLEESINYLKELDILKKKTLIEEFIKIFNNKRQEYFKKSRKTSDEFPTTLIFQETLEQLDLILQGNEKQDELISELANIYHLCEQDEWIPYKDTRETLTKLSEKGLMLGLLSNHPHHLAIEKILKNHEMAKYFEVIMTSGKFGERKPNKEIFLHTMEKMGLKNPKKVMMCGDEYADIIGAYKLGMIPVLFKRKFEFPFEKEIPIQNIKRIDKISEVLKFIN
ncbi:MAG: Phosphoglycolate phosphatase [Promethearchaeota archaeon]|nr:MAG: Phosphoglycolate phosphatase [Candidatus Lokiarchaeota archaeon]